MASGPYIAASADRTFRVLCEGGTGETIPSVLVEFHPLDCRSYHMIVRQRDGSERSFYCSCATSSTDLVDWWLGLVREIAAA